MTLFWILATLLALAVAIVVVLPVWRLPRSHEENLLDLNRRVFRERLAELEKDEADGRIDAATLAELRTELQRNLLLLDTPAGTAAVSSRRVVGWLAIVLIPLLSLFFYYAVMAPQSLGEWWQLRREMGPTVDQLLQGKPPAQDDNPGRTLADFVRVLQDRMQRQPDNAEGWFMLGMSYVQMDMPQPAQTAFEHAWRKNPEEPRYKLAYAQTLLFSNEGQLDETTRQLLDEVLAEQPGHEGALVLLGMGSFHSGDYATAVAALEKLKAVRAARHAEGGPGVMQQIDQTLASAREKLRQAGSGTVVASAPSALIRVTVKVDRALAGRFQPGDTVYIFARALSGPPMPVAVVRRPAGELPFTVDLDDSRSVMPTLKLSSVPEVAVTARISRHGSPEPQAGDFEAVPVPVRLGGKPQSIEVLIQSERR